MAMSLADFCARDGLDGCAEGREDLKQLLNKFFDTLLHEFGITHLLIGLSILSTPNLRMTWVILS